ncbi:hypothetical protein AVEN_77894-1 [Araneus ventricosus]|uniref:Uncharacterized protein n=1 Tax=Araneus ventricosus TaxID=182803 RepID=A0A4Y2RKC3_ARAVE|nr:hypothetical protein AVEN_77894-1 [Araneus ventricosus]
MIIPEDQQSYIRSMSLCTLKKSKVNTGLETRSCLESPRHARIGSGVACSALHFGQISKHLELSEKVKLLICPLSKRVTFNINPTARTVTIIPTTINVYLDCIYWNIINYFKGQLS